MTEPTHEADAVEPSRLGFAPGTKFKDPVHTETYRVFVSSADDVDASRRRARRLIEETFNDLLAQRSNAQLYADMWERATPRRLPKGKTINDEFVEHAVAAHGVLVLLKTKLGSGTRQEVNAVLAAPAEDVPLSVMRFADQDRKADTARMERFVTRLRAAKTVLYESTGLEGSDDAWISLTRTIGEFALAALEKSRELEREAGRNLVP